jgi:multidrug resistance protein, MATE family
VTANLFNFLFNWLFIFPHRWGSLHFGGMGVAGSGWSTCWARMYMAGLLVAAVLYYNRRDRLGLGHASMGVDLARIRSLLALGAPAATQIFFEIAVFSFTGVLAGKLGALPLAAHQIALNCAALSYMVPLGISSAAAVRTGNAWGRNQPQQAHRAGHAAILLGCGFMALSAVLFLTVPRAFARIFSPDVAVVTAGAQLLLIAAAFQLFDGLQIVMTGALRGIGNTRLPMLANFIGYWVLGLPLGALLCFHLGLGVFGLWIGLCAGLIFIGLILFVAWERRFQKVRSEQYEIVSSHE